MYNSSVTIAAPDAAAEGNWDASVIFTGLDSYVMQHFLASSGPTTAIYDSFHLGEGVYGLAALTVLSDAAGVDLSIKSDTAERAYLNSRNVADVPGRLIAVAYEVHNTTSVIEKQGSIVTAMVPSARDDKTVVNYVDSMAASAGNAVEAVSSNWLPTLPSKSDQVRAIPTSSQWDAAQGVYAIPRLNREHIPITVGRCNTSVSTSLTSAVTGPYVIMHSEPSVDYTELTYKTFAMLSPSVSSFSPMVSYFTGLSNSSTLTVTLRAVVEYFPGPYSDLLLNATPSSTYDPCVLQAYNETSRAAPYAVPVDMNAGGKYFKMVLSAASQAAPVVAGLLAGRPMASGFVRMIGNGAGMLRDRMDNRVVMEAAPRRRAVPAGNKPRPRNRVLATRGRVISKRAAGNGARPSK